MVHNSGASANLKFLFWKNIDPNDKFNTWESNNFYMGRNKKNCMQFGRLYS